MLKIKFVNKIYNLKYIKYKIIFMIKFIYF